MDPLSIAASAITLLQAAQAVSATLCDFVSTYRNADSRISTLCTELSTLTNFLEAVDRTLSGCRGCPLSLASMDEDLWRQSARCMSDCKTTLAELEGLVNKIKASAKQNGLFRRTKAAVDLTMFARDIAGFQEKVHKSNWALQTMLSAINVSLSLRSNSAQDIILYELSELKASVEQSLQAAIQHGGGFSHSLWDPSAARVAHNLRSLAKAAQSFHCSASSTASTIHGNGTAWNHVQSDTAMSVRGSLTFDKREQIKHYIKQVQGTTKRKLPPLNVAKPTTPPLMSPALKPASSAHSDSDVSDMEEDHDDEADDEAEFELLFISGLGEVAKESMLNQDFVKAETFLQKAIHRCTGSTPEDSDFRKLQIQLAVCYFFQHKWRLAEPLIVNIAKTKGGSDAAISNLLHALALAHLFDYQFETAFKICKQALHSKRKLKRVLGKSYTAEYNETLGLLAAIHEMKGDPVYAEVLRRTIPPDIVYSHPLDELEFIRNHSTLFQDIFNEDKPEGWGRPSLAASQAATVAELPIVDMRTPIGERVEEGAFARIPQPVKAQQTLRAKLDLFEKMELDTAKEAFIPMPSSAASDGSEADDEASSSAASDPSEQSPNAATPSIKRSLTRRLTRVLTVRQPSFGSTASTDADKSAETDDVSSPLRKRLRMGFRSKSNDDAVAPKRSKTKLQRSPRHEPRSFSLIKGQRPSGFRLLHMDPIDLGRPSSTDDNQKAEARTSRFQVDQWLRRSFRKAPSGDATWEQMLSDPRIPQEMDAEATVLELPDRSLNDSVPVSPVAQKERQRPDGHGIDTLPLPKVARQSSAYMPYRVPHGPYSSYLATESRLAKYSADTGKLREESNQSRLDSKALPLKPKLNIVIPNPAKYAAAPVLVAYCPTIWRPQLTITIPKSGRRSGTIQLMPFPPADVQSQQLGRLSNKKTPKEYNDQVAAAGKMARVLYAFDATADNELSVKEGEMIDILNQANNGWLLARSNGKDAWVPTSYVRVEPAINTFYVGGSRVVPVRATAEQSHEPIEPERIPLPMSPAIQTATVKPLARIAEEGQTYLSRSDTSRSWHYKDDEVFTTTPICPKTSQGLDVRRSASACEVNPERPSSPLTDVTTLRRPEVENLTTFLKRLHDSTFQPEGTVRYNKGMAVRSEDHGDPPLNWTFDEAVGLNDGDDSADSTIQKKPGSELQHCDHCVGGSVPDEVTQRQRYRLLKIEEEQSDSGYETLEESLKSRPALELEESS